MKKINIIRLSVLLWICIFASCSTKTDFSISSPDGQITAILKFNKEQGSVHYQVLSQKQEIISSSSMGISTSLGDFTSGMKLKGSSTKTIDETYHLPQGKVSTYRNHANEQTLTFNKNGQQLNILFRVYNDGIAYCYEIPGNGNIEFSGESSSINLADTNLTYYGQNHPNRYGYESALGPIDGEQMSNPVLAHLKDKNYFVLMGQAATYGNYVQTHFQRSDNRFTYSYPLDQKKTWSRTFYPPLSISLENGHHFSRKSRENCGILSGRKLKSTHKACLSKSGRINQRLGKAREGHVGFYCQRWRQTPYVDWCRKRNGLGVLYGGCRIC